MLHIDCKQLGKAKLLISGVWLISQVTLTLLLKWESKLIVKVYQITGILSSMSHVGCKHTPQLLHMFQSKNALYTDTRLLYSVHWHVREEKHGHQDDRQAPNTHVNTTARPGEACWDHWSVDIHALYGQHAKTPPWQLKNAPAKVAMCSYSYWEIPILINYNKQCTTEIPIL